MDRSLYSSFLKPFLDFLMSLFCLLVASPLLIAAMILIRITSAGPIFFSQERLGKNGNTFSLLKLRTMTHKERKTAEEIFAGNPDVTLVGRALRRFKIDELPQLVNVLRGEMSFVGPRPAMPEQLAEYDETSKKRLLVRPGLTGLSQISGNIYLTWPERWKLDVEYVYNLSLGLDSWILLKTIPIVLLGEHRFKKKNNHVGH